MRVRIPVSGNSTGMEPSNREARRPAATTLIRAIGCVLACGVIATIGGRPAMASRAGDVVCGVAVADFDGDGTTDLAVGWPVADVGDSVEAGLVKVFSGATGSSMASAERLMRGTSHNEGYGIALAALGDVDGDGTEDLAVAVDGSPKSRNRLEVVSVRGPKRISVLRLRSDQDSTLSHLGWILCALRKPGESARAILVGCDGRNRWMYSSLPSLSISTTIERRGWNLVTACSPGDVDGDGEADVVLGEFGAVVDGIVLVGRLRTVSSRYLRGGSEDKDMYVVQGTTGQRLLGSLLSSAGDWNGDGHDDVLAAVQGSPAAELPRYVVRVLSGSDGKELERFEGPPGEGSVLAAILVGDVDSGGRRDIVVGTEKGVHAVSRETGETLWSLDCELSTHFEKSVLFDEGSFLRGRTATLIAIALEKDGGGASAMLIDWRTGKVARRIAGVSPQ